MSVEHNKTIVRGYLQEVVSEGNVTAIDHYVSYEPGKQFMMEVSSWIRTVFPDFHLTIEDQIGEGDKVVTRVIFRGTHQGEFREIAPTGKEVVWQGILIDRIADAKVVEMWHEMDRLGLQDQIGTALW